MKRKKLEDRNIKLFCDVIFSLFAFIYLYFFQRDLLGMMYAVLPAADFLPFSPLVISLILTGILLFVAVQIRKLLSFQNMWYACNYLPSAFLLGLCTSCDKEHFFNLTEKSWYIVLLLFIAIMGVLKVLSMIPQGRNNIMKWPYSILLLLLTCCVTIFVGNSDENLHRELRVATLLNKSELEKALQIGIKSEESNDELTLLRAEAMLQLPSSELGSQLPERIFTYPISNARVFADSLYARTDSVVHRQDNAELVAMLVEKDLDKFVLSIDSDSEDHLRLSSWYPEKLPRYYMEAMVLHEYTSGVANEHLKNLYTSQYNKVVEEFNKYIESKKSFYVYSEQNRKNRLYMSHGTTYWWYYDFK